MWHAKCVPCGLCSPTCKSTSHSQPVTCSQHGGCISIIGYIIHGIRTIIVRCGDDMKVNTDLAGMAG